MIFFFKLFLIYVIKGKIKRIDLFVYIENLKGNDIPAESSKSKIKLKIIIFLQTVL